MIEQLSKCIQKNNNNNPGPTSTGGSENIKSCKDHDGAPGCELSRPTTICEWDRSAYRDPRLYVVEKHITRNRPLMVDYRKYMQIKTQSVSNELLVNNNIRFVEISLTPSISNQKRCRGGSAAIIQPTRK